ncbi:MAG: (d)CMP kinase [Acutalibacteraceae bacterium]
MISIAIDGPSGSGKSTISKILSQKLGFMNLDTGALYRALAYYLFKNNIDYTGGKLEEILRNINIKVVHENFVQRTYVNGEDVSDYIRSPEISLIASEISSFPDVREYFLNFQRDFAKSHNVIMDGRDIGTVVLPNADLKIFLTSSAEARAKRRYDQLAKNINNKISFQEVFDSISKRDYNDIHRKNSPLAPAKDALKFDNSELSLCETINHLLSVIKERVNIESK